jgi:PRTRC genetic system protein B
MTTSQQGTVVTFAEARSMPLTKAWLLYADHEGSFMTEHDVLDTKDGPIIGTGSPATVNGVRDALMTINQQRHDAAFLPVEVLCAAPGITIWWRTAITKRAFLRLEDTKTSGKAIDIPMPALCYCLSGNTFSVFALKRKTRPEANTPLFAAPLLNVFDGGTVCMGNVQAPKDKGVASIEEWERAFWHSTFTHANGQKQINRKGGLEAYWKACAGKAAPKSFDNDWLVPTRLTLASLISSARR